MRLRGTDRDRRRSTAPGGPAPTGPVRRRAGIRLGRRRRWSVLATGTAAALIGVLYLPGAGVAQAGLLSTSPVIVTDDTCADAVTLVQGLGGSIIADLPLIDGVAANVTSSVAQLLALVPGVTVTPDATVQVTGDADTSPRAPADVYPESTGATTLEAGGVNGSGVGVAVVDTGIDRLADFGDRVVGGVDLSGGGNPYDDAYGHGTFVAGIIGSDGALSHGTYQGEAPGADLIPIKVAGASGLTDLVTVLRGLQWALDHRLIDNIRVLNLSLGLPASTSTVIDPLDQAVEALWRAGIVVVTSAGNSGPGNGSIDSPGDDPLVLTAGALDDQGTADTSDDTMATFSSVGPTAPDGWSKPDLVTSGVSVVSLAAPGSTIDDSYPSARVGANYFAGSGTSFSAAVVSGAVALLLQALPNLDPDQVKARLLASASPGPVGDPFVDGHGALDVESAATMPAVSMVQENPVVAVPPGATVDMSNVWSGSSWDPGSWSGWSPLPPTAPPQDPGALIGQLSSGTVWNGTVWDGTVWQSEAWNGWGWDSATWQGAAWDGQPWKSEAWNDSSWGW